MGGQVGGVAASKRPVLGQRERNLGSACCRLPRGVESATALGYGPSVPMVPPREGATATSAWLLVGSRGHGWWFRPRARADSVRGGLWAQVAADAGHCIPLPPSPDNDKVDPLPIPQTGGAARREEDDSDGRVVA